MEWVIKHSKLCAHCACFNLVPKGQGLVLKHPCRFDRAEFDSLVMSDQNN